MSHSNRSSFRTASNSKILFDPTESYYTSQHDHPYQPSSFEHTLSIHSGTSASEGCESNHTVIEESSANEYKKGKNTEENNTELVPTPTHSSDYELKTYPIAWLLLFFIVLLRAAVAIFGNTFSPIPSVTAEFMGISLSSINWIYNIMSICYIVASCFTSYLYQKIGVKWSLLLSGVILSAGCWIRWIAVKINPPSFPVLMIGQTIASLSSPISLNIMTMFSMLWFTEDRRATAGMFIVSNYGAIIAMFLMPALATGKDKIELTVIVVACIATAATIPFVFFPTKPPTPASRPTQHHHATQTPELTLMQGTLLLLKNPHFLILCVVHGLNVGLSIAWNGIMNQAITPYGYTDSEIGNINAIGVVGGTLGCLMAGPIIDRTKQHKTLLKVMAPLMCSTYVAFIFVVKTDSFAAILYTNMLSQFFLSFMVPVCIELGVEISYPVADSLSTSILWQFCQLIGFILVLVIDKFRDEQGFPQNNLYKGLIFQAAIAGVCLIFAILFDGPMARSEALKQQQQQYDLSKQEKHGIAHHSSTDTMQTLLEDGAISKKPVKNDHRV
ncbi:major facilitator superfamily domain-containing protein [Gilbertella persicaria]|uniref:major facilitator superfamily domain-containing protein n=1 Tax=Gilbertella persicaria TaxID=101096 RepID=UPI002220AB59|nr:major facilitator superfamily domain-containing protein [Gilbertella persicaria]KAI8051365.1 major facilitator superfamily domain-containing protein [Gilbertella persicaria]